MNDDCIPFKYYMHDTMEPEEYFEMLEDQGVTLNSPKAEARFSPGYEVGLQCIVDPDTGETWAVGILNHGEVVPFMDRVAVGI